MFDFALNFPQGQTYHDFLAAHGSEEHRRRWAAVYDRVQLSTEQVQILRSFSRQLKVLCLAGAWCGDCVNQCPIFARFTEASAQLEIRYFDRDQHPQLRDALKICGGNRVPVVVFLSEDNQFLGLYGDRTLSKYRQLAVDQLGAACPTGILPPQQALLDVVTQEWLDEFERVQLKLRLSTRLRQRYAD